jgi:hypothetical protein
LGLVKFQSVGIGQKDGQGGFKLVPGIGNKLPLARDVLRQGIHRPAETGSKLKTSKSRQPG